MTEGVDDVALSSVEADPLFVGAVEDALSGPDTPVENPDNRVGADPHDFAGLYIRHRSSFAHHARRFLRDPRDVDEVVQEAFLRLFLALPELDTELQALSYCRRTVTNLCIDRYRADKRRPRLVNIEALPVSDFPDEELDDPVVQAEDAAFVREALALLTPLHRDALVKREIEEKSIPVIAEELGIPEESVKHLLHRARRALRRHLAKTHLAPGADLEATTTMALLARSAVSGGGRMAVVAVFLLLALAGVKPELPASALSSSWSDIAKAVQALSPPAPTHALKAAPRVRSRNVAPAPRYVPQRQTRVYFAPKVAAPPAPSTAPTPKTAKAVVKVLASPSPSGSPAVAVAARPKPATSTAAAPLAAASASPSPSPSLQSASAVPDASPKPSTSVGPSPTVSPSATATASPSASASPTPSPASGAVVKLS